MPALIDAQEELINDGRLWRIIDELEREFGRSKLDGCEYVTFIQPPKTTQVENAKGIMVPVHVEAMAVFAITEPNPRPQARQVGAKVMTHATVSLADWKERQMDNHFVDSRADPALTIFRLVARRHLETMDNLRAMV